MGVGEGEEIWWTFWAHIASTCSALPLASPGEGFATCLGLRHWVRWQGCSHANTYSLLTACDHPKFSARKLGSNKTKNPLTQVFSGSCGGAGGDPGTEPVERDRVMSWRDACESLGV